MDVIQGKYIVAFSFLLLSQRVQHRISQLLQQENIPLLLLFFGRWGELQCFLNPLLLTITIEYVFQFGMVNNRLEMPQYVRNFFS